MDGRIRHIVNCTCPPLVTVLLVVVLAAAVHVHAHEADTTKDAVGLTDAQASSPYDGSSTTFIAVVGRLLQCGSTAQLSVAQLRAVAEQVSQGETSRAGLLTHGSGLIEVGCSLHLAEQADSRRQETRAGWQPGPFLQQQHLTVSGLRVLDCLALSDQRTSNQDHAPYIFLLHSQGALASGQQPPLEAIEYTQLWGPQEEKHTTPSGSAALLSAWLGTDLPDSCQQALASTGGSVGATDRQQAAAQEDSSDSSKSMPVETFAASSRRRLQQAAGASGNSNATAAAPANMTGATAANNATGAGAANSSSPAPSQPAAPAGKQSGQMPGAEGSMGAPAPDNSTVVATSKASKGADSNATNRVFAQDQLLPDAINATKNATNMSAEIARTVCALQPETGPCRGAIPRWAFDVATGACKEFIYGGCDGNKNNFQSQAACEAACLAVMSGAGGKVAPAPAAAPGPVTTTVEDPRVLTGSSGPASPSSKARDRSLAEQLLRIALAGAVAALTLLLL